MRKILYGSLVLMLMLSLVFVGVGCGGNGDEEPASQEDTATEADTEETETTTEDEETTEETAAAELPIYPGSEVDDEFTGFYKTSDSVEDVKDFYEKNLPNYTVEEEEITGGYIFSADGETTVNLWIGDSDTVLIEFADY